jgi:hypothetical protein
MIFPHRGYLFELLTYVESIVRSPFHHVLQRQTRNTSRQAPAPSCFTRFGTCLRDEAGNTTKIENASSVSIFSSLSNPPFTHHDHHPSLRPSIPRRIYVSFEFHPLIHFYCFLFLFFCPGFYCRFRPPFYALVLSARRLLIRNPLVRHDFRRR